MIATNKTNVEISAVITRADGTVEDLGVICKTENDGNNNKKFSAKGLLGKVKNFVGKVISKD